MDKEARFQTLTKLSEVRAALEDLREALRVAIADVSRVHWSFPGHGSTRDGIPTWSRDGDEAISVAVGEDGHWGNRTPVLIALTAAFPRICPTVEVNIPHTRGQSDRSINGVFGRSPDGALWLLHRGVRFTAHGGTIRKAEIHEHFANKIQQVWDKDRLVWVIPVAGVGSPHFVSGLRDFAVDVEALKSSRIDAPQPE